MTDGFTNTGYPVPEYGGGFPYGGPPPYTLTPFKPATHYVYATLSEYGVTDLVVLCRNDPDDPDRDCVWANDYDDGPNSGHGCVLSSFLNESPTAVEWALPNQTAPDAGADPAGVAATVELPSPAHVAWEHDEYPTVYIHNPEGAYRVRP